MDNEARVARLELAIVTLSKVLYSKFMPTTALGDSSGHPFHGNQWSKGSDSEKETKPAFRPPPPGSRDDRIARQKAARGTDEWKAKGEAYAKAKADAEAKAKNDAAAAKAREGFVSRTHPDAIERAALKVNPNTLGKARDHIENMIKDIKGDHPHVNEDDVAHDAMRAHQDSIPANNERNVGLIHEIGRTMNADSPHETSRYIRERGY